MARLEYCPDCERKLVTYEYQGYVVVRCPHFNPLVQNTHYYSVYDTRDGYGGLGDHGKPYEDMFDGAGVA